MAEKLKIKCSRCSKSFKTSQAKKIMCPDCESKEAKERQLKKNAPLLASTAPPPPSAAEVLAAAEAARIQAKKEAEAAAAAAIAARAQEEREKTETRRRERTEREAALRPAAAQPEDSQLKPRRAAKQVKEPKPPPPPKPPKALKPPTLPFVPTPEQVAAIEARYLELAVPKEFDGIRTQIAKELAIPKIGVKAVVKALRERMKLPSWWEARGFIGTPEQLEQIRAVYVPLLPIPPTGVHKEIATQLGLSGGVVYSAIGTIRAELNLPRFTEREGFTYKPDPADQIALEPVASSAVSAATTERSTGEDAARSPADINASLDHPQAAPDTGAAPTEVARATELNLPRTLAEDGRAIKQGELAVDQVVPVAVAAGESQPVPAEAPRSGMKPEPSEKLAG